MTSPLPVSPSRSKWSLLLCTLLGVALGAWGGVYYVEQSSQMASHVDITPEQLAAQNAAVYQSQTESKFLRAQLDTADGEIAIERAARQELELQLRTAQDELGQVRERLAFFEQLLPPGPGGAVDIRGAEVFRDGNGLKYRILLIRNGPTNTTFDGSLKFQASGVLHGVETQVDLEPMQVKVDSPAEGATEGGTGASAPNAASDLFSLKFDKYQRSEGVLRVPDGFVPETVVVSVLEGNTVRATRTIRLGF
jgi:hypothetical protein